MKKILIILLSLLVLVILAVLGMFATNTCPPAGPWPTPPWCQAKMAQDFKVQNLNYISYPTGNLRPLTLGIGTMDIWGNPHLFLNLGEDTAKNYESALKRIGQIGSQAYLFTDFINLGAGKEIKILDQETFPATFNIPTADLKKLADTARANDQKRLLMLTNLSDTKNEIEGFIASAEKDSNVKEKVMGTLFKKFTESSTGLTSAENLKSFSTADWTEFLANLKLAIVGQAQKAQAAGFTDFVLNPGDIIVDYYYPGDLSSYWAEVLKEVRLVFKGKIGFFGYPDILARTKLGDYDFTLVYLEMNGDRASRDLFNNSTVELAAFKTAWEKYLAQDFWKKIPNEKILLVTIPSYAGVRSRGWIEPGELHSDLVRDDREQALLYESLFETITEKADIKTLISYGYWWSPNMYPASKPLRNDLSHSIRAKDAENVFYYWAKK